MTPLAMTKAHQTCSRQNDLDHYSWCLLEAEFAASSIAAAAAAVVNMAAKSLPADEALSFAGSDSLGGIGAGLGESYSLSSTQGLPCSPSKSLLAD